MFIFPSTIKLVIKLEVVQVGFFASEPIFLRDNARLPLNLRDIH
jgi:hypothetical protein